MNSLPDKDIRCHRTGFEKSCRTLVCKGACRRWMHIIGQDPNTGGSVDQFDCVDNWLPKLLIENSQMQRQTAASVDKTATEIRRFHENMAHFNNALIDDNAHLLLPNKKAV